MPLLAPWTFIKTTYFHSAIAIQKCEILLFLCSSEAKKKIKIHNFPRLQALRGIVGVITWFRLMGYNGNCCFENKEKLYFCIL